MHVILKPTLATAALSLSLLATSIHEARAQGDACAGNVVVVSLSVVRSYRSSGQSRSDYAVAVRNFSAAPRSFTISFEGFPQTWFVWNPRETVARLGSNTQQQITFGYTSDPRQSLSTIPVVYDSTSGPSPRIALTNCRRV